MQRIILGCGSSFGVPSAVGHWGLCDPKEPKNKRTRTSLAIASDSGVWLIDASPDLRVQMLRENLRTISGILISHAHADHIGGLDDLRAFSLEQRQAIPVYANQETCLYLQQRYAYADFLRFIPFETNPELPWSLRILKQQHGSTTSLGFLFEDWAYSTDISELPEETLVSLAKARLNLWIVSCLSWERETQGHASWKRVQEWIAYVKPQRVILTHLGYDIDYQICSQQLPPFCGLAYDGMRLD